MLFQFVTVPHTGTMHTIELLDLRVRPLAERQLPSTFGGEKPFSHCDDEAMELIVATAEEMPILTTQRNWADVERSWVNRGKDLRELDRYRKNYEALWRVRRPYVLKLGE
jgi:hypothetical protein